jgi:hypothetical protein
MTSLVIISEIGVLFFIISGFKFYLNLQPSTLKNHDKYHAEDRMIGIF